MISSTSSIQLSGDHYKKAFFCSASGIALVGVDGHFLDVNPALCRLLGYTRTELLSKRLSDITCEADQAVGKDSVKRMLEGDIQETTFERRCVHKNGEIIWASVCTTCQRDAEGAPECFITQIQDITGQKSMERDLSRHHAARIAEETKAHIALITDGVPALTARIDRSHRYLFVNQPYAELYSIRRESIVGRTVKELIGETAHQQALPFIEKALSGEAVSLEQSLKDRFGRNRVMDVTMTPVVDSDGHVESCVMLAKDVTKHKAVERAMAERLRFEKGLARAAQALLVKSGNRDNVARSALEHLLEAIDSCRIYVCEAVEDEDGLTDFRCLMSVERAGLMSPALRKGPPRKIADRLRARLLAGEIIHGPASVHPTEEREFLLRQGVQSVMMVPVVVGTRCFGFISVQDTRSARVWHTPEIQMIRTASYMIGAYLTRLNDGAKLPASGDSVAPTALHIEESTTGCAILVAEDHPANRMVISYYLERDGHRVTVVEDGVEAQEACADKKFDIIFMDVQMPRVSGIEATRFVREGNTENRQVPIIGVTVSEEMRTRQACLAAGMNDVFLKPVCAELLKDATRRWCPPRKQTSSSPSSHAPRTAADQPPHETIVASDTRITDHP